MTTIALLGDIHGDMNQLAAALPHVRGKVDALIQVGDFGFDHVSMSWLKRRPNGFDFPVYLLDGNHEVHDMLPSLAPGLYELATNCWYVGRGTVLEIGGARIGCMGGGDSIDKAIRLKLCMHWSPDEVITKPQCDALLRTVRETGALDLLVTHCPPESLIARHFDPNAKVRLFGVPADWTGAGSSLWLDYLWGLLGSPPLVCGHMHRQVLGEGYTMLGVNELRVMTVSDGVVTRAA